jgi:signal transduction histidine kinase
MPSPSRFASRSSISFLAGLGLGALAASLVERRRSSRVQERLRAQEAEQARLSAQLVTAEQDERRRLSLALHDGPLQSLSGIVLMHDAGLRAIREGRPEEAERVLASAIEREREAIQALRDLSFAMEPIVLRDHGFEAAVTALADQLRGNRDLDFDLDVAAGERLGEKAQVALYQTVREALAQASRRNPSHVSISIQLAADGGVTASITDDGVNERRRGNFEAIGERARIVNGRVELEADPRGGTSVRVFIPAYAAAV